MTTIKINAITVPAGSGDELAQRFAARAGAVDDADGFEGFELLRPTDEREQWLVITRWRDEESFQAWVSSPDSPRATGLRPTRRRRDTTAGLDPQRSVELRSGRRLDTRDQLTALLGIAYRGPAWPPRRTSIPRWLRRVRVRRQ